MLLKFLLFLSLTAGFAQNKGFMKGEVNPQKGLPNDLSKVDPKKLCPPGQRRFPAIKCVNPTDPIAAENAQPKCMGRVPILECRKKPAEPRCKSPEVSMELFRCKKL